MPSIGRIVLPYYPHHVVQRGHDRNDVFIEEQDYRYYLDTLREFKDVFGIKVYAYCLMTNHVHLLLEPSDLSGIGQMMKRLAGRQRAIVTSLRIGVGHYGKGGINQALLMQMNIYWPVLDALS